MNTTLFVINLPPTMTEPRLRRLMDDDPLAVVSFVHSVTGTVALVEPATSVDATQIEGALASAKPSGRALEVIRGNSPAGRQLGEMFRDLRRRELHRIG
jgi:hypothetical protein